MKKTEKQKSKEKNSISRKEMLKKLGLTAFSAASMILLLNEPMKAQDTGNSPDLPPDWINGLSDSQADDIINALAEEEKKKKALP